MKSLVQSVRTGELELVELPALHPSATKVAVDTTASVLSAGTERAVRRLASASLLGKAKARPELVRQVVAKLRNDGVRETVRSVRSRLDDLMPLGYSGAGVVAEVGEAVAGIAPGDRVATAGAGHAEQQVVAGHLAVRIPDEVPDEAACFATICSIGLHALRLADVGPGAKVGVIGLGLVGQLTARLARASGVDVVGVDVDRWKIERAGSHCLALPEQGQETTDAIVDWSRGRGLDAVLVTAAAADSAPLQRAPALCRDRATIVVVGDVGMELERPPLYEKELTVRVARSYGPGRYDPSYEEWGVDYPAGHVPWTEGRNIEAILDLMAAGRLQVEDLVTHRFAFDRALEAYALLEAKTPYLGIALEYPRAQQHRATAVAIAPKRSGGDGVGIVGAGAFVRSTMIPALRSAGFDRLVSITSAGGLSARSVGERASIEKVVSGVDEMLEDPDVGTVIIATPHSTHAHLTIRALNAGNHVFCEKPLALTMDELEQIVSTWRTEAGHLAVGFNRRHAPAVEALRKALATSSGPLVITYRVNAGKPPTSHWYHDRIEGGRLLGEGCHFVDVCNALVDSAPVQVVAYGTGADEALLAHDFVVMLRYSDGSLACVTYASSGHSSTRKERLEVLGRGHTAVVDDFCRCTIDGKTVWKGAQDKGHVALLRRFREELRTGRSQSAERSIASSAATLAAAASLVTGKAEQPSSF